MTDEATLQMLLSRVALFRRRAAGEADTPPPLGRAVDVPPGPDLSQ